MHGFNIVVQDLENKACFKRRASHVPNTLETTDYQLFLMRSAHEKRDV